MIKANLWFTNLSTTEQSPDASYRLSIIKRSDGMQYVVKFQLMQKWVRTPL